MISQLWWLDINNTTLISSNNKEKMENVYQSLKLVNTTQPLCKPAIVKMCK